jgi:hypothetical protein
LLEALGEALSAYGGATLGKDRAAFKALMEESRRYLDRGGTPSP